MQVQKEELRQKLLEAAEDEFLRRGYEAASLRVIAKKANTTIGNIYHYFPNKEAILIELLEPTICNLEKLIKLHLEDDFHPGTSEEVGEYIDQYEQEGRHDEFEYMLDKRIVILLELKSSSLMERKEAILEQFRKHLRWHMKFIDEDAHYSEIFIDMFTASLKHVLIEHTDRQKARKELVKFFRAICTGIIRMD